MKRAISALILIIFSLSLIPVGSSAEDLVRVYINGVDAALKNKPYLDNGIWMVPFKETMDKLGVPVEWDEDAAAFKGSLNNVEISVKPDSDEEIFDLIDFDLERRTVGVDGDAMVQLDFIDKLYGSTVKAEGKRIYINLTIPRSDKEEFVLDDYLATLPTPQDVCDCEDFYTTNYDSDTLSTHIVTETDDARFDRALQIDNYVQLFQYWDSQISVKSKIDLNTGDICVISFWARSVKSADESGQSEFGFCHEVEKTWIKMCEIPDCWAGGEWKRFQTVYKISERIPAGQSGFKIRVGYFIQSLQITGMEIKSYGKTYDESIYKPDDKNLVTDGSDSNIYKQYSDEYYGHEDGALWREEALKRIEKVRVRDINVNVTDENGKPVSGAKISADMTRSEFAWGSMAEEWQLDWNGMMSNKFRNVFLKNFNAISLGNVHKYSFSDMGIAAEATNFVRENNLYNRFHNIFWDHENFFYNRGYDKTKNFKVDPEASEDEVFEIFAKHASRELYNYGDTYDEIDVVNEPFAYEHFQSRYGRQFIADLYKLTKDISPDSILLMNDGLNGGIDDWRKAYFIKAWVDDVQSLGGPIDGLGLETHLEWATYPQLFYNQIEYVTQNVDYASVTEFDFKASDIADYYKRMEYEKDVFRDFLIISYSFPKMIGFHMWGFADFNHWRGNAPLYDTGLNEKPTITPWKELVLGEWFTKTSAETDSSGSAVMRGHRGEYEIKVEMDGKVGRTTLVVSENGINTVNAVVGDSGIKLDSSDLVVNKYASNPKLNYTAEANYTEENLSNMYKTLYKNYVETVTDENGMSIDFLKKDVSGVGNDTLTDEKYALKNGKSLIVKLSRSFNKGVIRLIMSKVDNTADICKIEGRTAGGSWEPIGTADNLTDKYFSFDFPVNEIRLTGIGTGQIFLKNIHVSEKEWVRWKKDM